jgi:glutaminyl-tRNA synthetase
MKDVKSGQKYQFFRHGYFSADPKYTKEGKLVFNRIVSLKSSFKIKK